MPHIPQMKIELVTLDRDDGRAEVILGSPDGASFVILRGAAGNWADGSVVPLFSPGDTFENFWVLSGREAALLTREALAAVPALKPIRNH